MEQSQTEPNIVSAPNVGAIAKYIAAIRTLIYFLVWFLPYNAIYCTLVILFTWAIPHKWRNQVVVKCWSVPLIWGARWILGIRYQVIGRDRLPPSAVVIGNHQSTWETIFMLTLFSPQVTVLKKSLLNVPFYGWAMRAVDPIAIDRDNPRTAAKMVMEQGAARLKAGMAYLFIYPEGTRRMPGDLGKFNRSAANLAKLAKRPLVPVSQNSGIIWRRDSRIIYPGLVTVTIHDAIDCTELTALDATNQARAVIEQNLKKIS